MAHSTRRLSSLATASRPHRPSLLMPLTRLSNKGSTAAAATYINSPNKASSASGRRLARCHHSAIRNTNPHCNKPVRELLAALPMASSMTLA